MDNITGFEKHVILYAKGWYNKTKDPIRDLKKLLAHYCATEVKDIRTKHIYNFLISTFLKTIDAKRNTCVYTEAIAEMIGQKWGRKGIIKDRPAYRVLLGNISICGGAYADLGVTIRKFAIPDFDEQKERVQKVLDKVIKV